MKDRTKHGPTAKQNKGTNPEFVRATLFKRKTGYTWPEWYRAVEKQINAGATK